MVLASLLNVNDVTRVSSPKFRSALGNHLAHPRGKPREPGRILPKPQTPTRFLAEFFFPSGKKVARDQCRARIGSIQFLELIKMSLERNSKRNRATPITWIS
jgi:hypothetical protein